MRYRVTCRECEAYQNDMYLDGGSVQPGTPTTPTEPADPVVAIDPTRPMDQRIQQIFTRLLSSSKGQLVLVGVLAAIALLATKTITSQA